MHALMLSLQLSVLSILAPGPEADVAVAVAIGLAHADRVTIDVPVTVEVAEIKPSMEADGAKPQLNTIEWVRTCDQYGCRLVPRTPSPNALVVPPAGSQVAAEASPTTKEDAARVYW